MKRSSLGARLLLAATAWIVLALVATAFALTALFRQHVESELAERMRGHLDDLVAALARSADGSVTVGRELSEPLFRRPYGGFYWIVQRPDGTLVRSRSLWDHSLDLAPLAAAGADVTRVEGEGPRAQPVVFWARRIRLPGVDGPILVAVGADVSRLQATTRSFARTLAAALAVVAVALVAAAVLQVRLGLKPLRQLHGALLDLRARRAERVVGAYPGEVQPLVDDLNAVLAENAGIVERARAQTGNLAHGLKTPLAVIANVSDRLPGPDGELMRSQVDRMRRQVEMHLVRARAAAAARGTGQATPVRPAVDDLVRTIERLYGDRHLRITVCHAEPAAFPGDAQELHEMLGNLLDNAGKWARSQVVVSAGARDGRLVFEIDDDGPGVPPAERAAILERGKRLDETHPGTGLGLANVDDLARMCGGSLRLDASPLGGLRARLDLPAAQPPAA